MCSGSYQDRGVETMLALGKTYTTAARTTVYKAKRFPDGRLFLCDMNRSRSWEDFKGKQGWGDGYLVNGISATLHAYQVADGVTSLLPLPGAAVLNIEDFVACDVVSRKVDVLEWLAEDATMNEYRPDYVSPPGETLLELLQGLEMSPPDLARHMDIDVGLIDGIIKGVVPITPEIALALEWALGKPTAVFWENRERIYRENLAKKENHAKTRRPK